MDALEAIFTRRSTRRMKAELPPPELIQNIIEAGSGERLELEDPEW